MDRDTFEVFTREEIAALRSRVAKLEAKASECAQVEAELLEAARQWARLMKLGFYVDSQGCRVLVCHSDVAACAETYTVRMRQLAVSLPSVEVT